MAATVEANGGAASGQQKAGVVAQYQVDGKLGVAERSSTSINPGGGASGVTPYDSGTILGTVPPGKPGLKLVNGTIQRAAALICDSTAGVTGNALVCTSGVGVVPTIPTGQGKSAGLSITSES
jgi:hypothetical protein